MALTRAKYRRLPELWVAGTQARLDHETVLWLQVPNQFQRDEAQHDAQAARSRLILALKSEAGSEERDKVTSAVLAEGPQAVIEEMCELESQRLLLKAILSMEDDPDWSEKLDVLRRSDDLAGTSAEPIEAELLLTLNREYLAEAERRSADELTEYRAGLTHLEGDALTERYLDLYMAKRGDQVAQAEYLLTELWYAARVCAGTQDDDDTWDHSACDGHRLTAFETKQEIRDLPDHLVEFLSDKLSAVQMTVREAGNSARQGSS